MPVYKATTNNRRYTFQIIEKVVIEKIHVYSFNAKDRGQAVEFMRKEFENQTFESGYVGDDLRTNHQTTITPEQFGKPTRILKLNDIVISTNMKESNETLDNSGHTLQSSNDGEGAVPVASNF